MLREMGLRLLPPLQAPQSAPESTEAEAPVEVRASAQPQRMPPPDAPPSDSGDDSGRELAREGTADLASLGWDELRAAASDFATRDGSSRRVVFGVGPQQADWMVIGEAPGEAEEQQGLPFAGTVGKLLDGMLRAMGLDPARDVYVTNLLKCRPPGDRNPDPEELAAWEPFLRREVALVRPRMLLVMGRFAVPRLLRTQEPIGRLRGRAHAYDGVPVVVTYHPAYLLRNLPDKAKAWADLCLAQDLVAGDQPPASGR